MLKTKVQELTQKHRRTLELDWTNRDLNAHDRRIGARLTANSYRPSMYPGEREHLMKCDIEIWDQKLKISQERDALWEDILKLETEIRSLIPSTGVGVLVEAAGRLHPKHYRLESDMAKAISEMAKGLSPQEKQTLAGAVSSRGRFWMNYFGVNNDPNNVNISISGTDMDIGWSCAESMASAYIQIMGTLRPFTDETLRLASQSTSYDISGSARTALRES